MSDYVQPPANTDEAASLVQAICSNLNRLAGPVQQSMRHWDRQGAGLFARAVKECYYYSHGHVLGSTLRSLANTAIIIEHRHATAGKS
jgi:hypothetical protein